MSAFRVLCFSGGAGSTALLLLALQQDPPDLVVFADIRAVASDEVGVRSLRARRVLALCRRHRVPFHWLTPGPGTYCDRIVSYVKERYPGIEAVELWAGYEAGEDARAAADPCGQEFPMRFPLIEKGICRCGALKMLKINGFQVQRRFDRVCSLHPPSS